jgi:tetratricopeptide (TPR) repeat protein
MAPGAGAMGAPRGAGPMSDQPSGPAETGVDLPLPLQGLGSVHELERALRRIPGEEDRKAFESAFRLTFTADRQRRDFAEAESAFKDILTRNPNLAEAYRGLAYAEFNRSMNFPATIELYEKAIQLDPDYGEAHYALAFMLGPGDPERGRIHFQRAMDLGVKDERNLRQRFFSGDR